MRRRAGWAAAVLAAALGCAPGGQRNGGRETMSDERDKAVKFLTLPDADYADLKGNRLTEFQSKFGGLFDSDDLDAPPGGTAMLAIGAPKRADFDSGKEIPILVGLRTTGLRRWEVDPRQNALLIGVDLRSGAVYSGWPLVNDKRRRTPDPSRTGEPPQEEDATVLTTSVQKVDLRKGLEGKWGAARLALTAVIYDWVSNTVVIDLTKKGQEPAALAPRSESALLSRSKPGGEVPKLDGSGAVLQVPTNVDPGDPAFLGGAVDLPASEVVTVPSSAPEGG